MDRAGGTGRAIITNAQHRLVTVEGTEKRPILVIESTYQTEAFEWDMTEILSSPWPPQAGQETLRSSNC